jgi:pimeloyl-ACP methyl ester carboxylesterase
MANSVRTATGTLAAHRSAGQTFTAGGVQSFLLSEGDGEPVVCIHGMFGSSFGFRKVIHELALRGLRGMAWDLPGFGLAGRPENYDYSWTNLGRFCQDAVAVLNLDRFHLVVHDIGGPVGFELAAACPERIASLTVLNTVVDVAGWRPTWTMRPFRWPVIGELWTAGITPPAFRFLMRLQGIGDISKVSKAELNTYLKLMRGNDRGRAFLKVSRSAQATTGKQDLYRRVAAGGPYPVQVIWAGQDPAMPAGSYGERARAAAGLPALDTIPGKHFPQEDQAAAIAERIAAIAAA